MGYKEITKHPLEYITKLIVVTTFVIVMGNIVVWLLKTLT